MRKRLNVTVDDNRCRGAASLGHDVLRHAGVVRRVGEAGLLDDEVVVDGDVEVPVVCRVDDLLVLQPLHLGEEEKRHMRGANPRDARFRAMTSLARGGEKKKKSHR